MRKFITAVLVSLFVLIPISGNASWYSTDPETLARWAGCTATVDARSDISAGRSFYSSDHVLHIGTGNDIQLNYRILIYFHEIGHCIQAQEGRFNPMVWDRREIELDADRRAADFACRYQMDGKSLLRQLFEWARDTYGYYGDPDHGTLDQRISQGELAEACRVVPVQTL